MGKKNTKQMAEVQENTNNLGEETNQGLAGVGKIHPSASLITKEMQNKTRMRNRFFTFQFGKDCKVCSHFGSI